MKIYTKLVLDIDNNVQKDLSSVPISEINLPKIVYMVVDKNIELQTKSLKDYPKWDFLSKNELERKTIEIHNDLKIAKSSCNKDQKVIKIPNSNVFKIVAYIMILRVREAQKLWRSRLKEKKNLLKKKQKN